MWPGGWDGAAGRWVELRRLRDLVAVTMWGQGQATIHCPQVTARGTGSTGRSVQRADCSSVLALCCHHPKISAPNSILRPLGHVPCPCSSRLVSMKTPGLQGGNKSPSSAGSSSTLVPCCHHPAIPRSLLRLAGSLVGRVLSQMARELCPRARSGILVQ